MSGSKRPFLELDDSMSKNGFGDCYEHWLKKYASSTDPTAEFKSIKPKKGFCVKARTDDNSKMFLNICHSEDVPPPPESLDFNAILSTGSDEESLFRFPLSLGEFHTELDKSKNSCKCVDIVINSKFYEKVEKSSDLRDFIMTLSCVGLEKKYDINIDVATCNLLKRPYFGVMPPHYIKLKSRANSDLAFFDKDAAVEKMAMPDALSSHVMSGDPNDVVMPVQNPVISSSLEITNVKFFQSPAEGDPALIIFQGMIKYVTDIKEIRVFVSDRNLTLKGPGKKVFVDIELPVPVLPELSLSNFNKSKLVIAMPVAAIE